MVWFFDFEKFYVAAKKLFFSNPLKTRFLFKYRNCDGKVVLKVTDDQVCLKIATKYSQDLKHIKRINNLFIQSMANKDLQTNQKETSKEQNKKKKVRAKH
ncbi:signal recognition particle 9 kda protein [Anaeramoeba flamelloides]|uniref:Signal recognition particle 9 kDa protein n=1 Tax=Anaeramoeba flamelloides TaxID=1746091 RepID=A0AAV7YUS0_9EUKA|nr:signal recognition particle 9 kda protein [Anaeramoeba flamelloides]KAJ3433264.1 signal recognition particle 9 kda protein [Anaeramoeba flamelloides]KAJ6228519.1 signal recognition particle 9 kda protein [Anaeramoeba flamelloides]KAJ6238697.1 signal recognition particle 9 kda protein [Anaeramoeba flamelloides]